MHIITPLSNVDQRVKIKIQQNYYTIRIIIVDNNMYL